jgi:dinuclear metal center YbgI/SA1388 family protein
MHNVADIAAFLDRFAPHDLAESWDNVGLLVGSLASPVSRIMTCLTVTPQTAREAIDNRAELIISHHPVLFRPLKRLTDQTSEGRVLLELTAAQVAVYSPHTAFDSAAQGINERLASGLRLQNITPLAPLDDPARGAGRQGRLPRPVSLAALADAVKLLLGIERAQVVGELERTVERVAVACGSAGEFVPLAKAERCQALVTGEVRFHTALEAEAIELGLVLAGHFASERFALDALAQELSTAFPKLHVWASAEERDPLKWR